MDNTKNNSYLHLQTVCKCHFILRNFPDRINAEGKDTIFRPYCYFSLSTPDNIVTACKYPKIQSKKLIIQQSTVPHKENHRPKPRISLKMNQQRYSHKHMSNITKHDSNKESKGYYIKWCWIDFTIRWNTICIDNLLRNCKHDVGIKFTWWHFWALFNIQY